MNQPELHFYDMGLGVTAFSSTRHGGCSTGSYAEFNINRYCGDDDEHIARNRVALCLQLGIGDDRLIMPHQVHQTVVTCIDEDFMALSAEARQQQLEGVDALCTSLTGVCIGVSTADCIPILLYDSEHRAAAAVHAGWRGTVGRIAQKAVETMVSQYASRPEALTAVIGPGISLESFEVGQEVYDAFAAAGFSMEPISRRFPVAGNGDQEKWHIDLPRCNREQLQESGVSERNILATGICTFRQHADFFSARRLTIHSGRIFTGIILRK